MKKFTSWIRALPVAVATLAFAATPAALASGRHHHGHGHHGHGHHGHGHGHHHWGHRHHHGHWHGRHHHHGPGPLFWFGTGLLSGYLVGHHGHRTSARPDMTTDDAAAACARTYRSYEPTTGLFTSTSGEKKLCPYLK
jgi:hypothetical protein